MIYVTKLGCWVFWGFFWLFNAREEKKNQKQNSKIRTEFVSEDFAVAQGHMVAPSVQRSALAYSVEAAHGVLTIRSTCISCTSCRQPCIEGVAVHSRKYKVETVIKIKMHIKKKNNKKKTFG